MLTHFAGLSLVALPLLFSACEQGPTEADSKLARSDPAGLATPASVRIEFTTLTSGPDADRDGYTLELVAQSGLTAQAVISSTGTITMPPLLAGSYTFTLKGVAENCVARGEGLGKPRVFDDAIASVSLEIGCAPPTQLAFVRDGQIYRVNSNGTGLVQLTGAGFSNQDPVWSPDGRRIAFTSNRGGGHDIYVMNADGSNVVRRTNAGDNAAPAWSPDGNKIAFSSLRGGENGIYVMNVDADWSSVTRLGFERGYNDQPAWSPDGRTITFVSDSRAYDFLFDLYIMNADGSDIRTLIAGPFFWSAGLTFYFQPAWSPDGRELAVVVCGWAWDNCYPNSTLRIFNLGGTERGVVAAPGGFAKPSWSPDGRTLAFSSSTCRQCLSSIRYVRADGTYNGLIITNGHSPSWRP